MLPGSQFEFNNSLFPNAPSDLICALGKNGQLLHISNSENLLETANEDLEEDDLEIPAFLRRQKN